MSSHILFLLLINSFLNYHTQIIIALTLFTSRTTFLVLHHIHALISILPTNLCSITGLIKRNNKVLITLLSLISIPYIVILCKNHSHLVSIMFESQQKNILTSIPIFLKHHMAVLNHSM